MARPKGSKDRSPTAFANRSKAHIAMWQRDREARTKAITEACNTPEHCIAAAERAYENWADDDYRTKVSVAMSAAMKQWWAKRKQQQP